MMELTSRLKKLQNRLFNIEYQDPGIWHFQGTNILDIAENSFMKDEPMVVRKAYAQQHICKYLPVVIKPDELVVGCPNQNSVGWGSVIPKYFTAEEQKLAGRYELDECSLWGHHPPRFDKMIDIGVIGVKAEVEAALKEELTKDTPDEVSINNYRSMLIALDGLVIYANRYAAEALKQAQSCQDPDRRQELLEIYAVCSHVPYHPARTLQEAAQTYWFTYSVVNSGGEFIPLGRADQYLYKYYQADLEAGRITRERGIDIIGSFLIKCNERIIIDTTKAENHFSFGLFSQGKIFNEEEGENNINGTGGYAQRGLKWNPDEDENSEANYNYGQSGNDWLMNCIVGGTDAWGNDATNEISYWFVDLMHSMNLLMPTLGTRVHKNSPVSFLELISEALRFGQGEPIIYNDDAIVPGFVDLGIPVEEARDYCSDGCWEVLITGKSHFSYAHVMNLQCLEWALTRGETLLTGEKDGLDSGDPEGFKTFEDLYEAYMQQVYDKIDFQCQRRLENFGLSYMIAPDPIFSSITDDCVKKGRDISQDGARYIFHLILITGLSNTVDSLAAIKKVVYEDQKATLSEVIEALRCNWKGYEKLQAMMMNAVPKFGNDDDYADDVAVRLMKDFEDKVVSWREKQDKILFPCGIGTFENYAVLGRDIGASADGRGAGEALASNYSPTPGADKSGPTSVIKSITKPDLLRYYCGCPLDIAVNSNEFVGDEGVGRMKDLIRSFCDLGGQIMTITSANADVLKDAKVHPEKHKNLRVRMGGLSAYFIAMAPAQQDNIIKRFSK